MVRQRFAKPSSPVQIRVPPPFFPPGADGFRCCFARSASAPRPVIPGSRDAGAIPAGLRAGAASIFFFPGLMVFVAALRGAQALRGLSSPVPVMLAQSLRVCAWVSPPTMPRKRRGTWPRDTFGADLRQVRILLGPLRSAFSGSGWSRWSAGVGLRCPPTQRGKA